MGNAVILFKLKYLKEEFGELKFIAKKAELEINQKIRELQYELNVFDPLFDGVDNKGEKNFLHSSGSIDDHDVVLEVDPKIEHSKLIKKLYRSLAMKLHPDKWKNNITPEEREEAVKNFDLIDKDYKQKEYSQLVETAHDLKIELDYSKDEYLAILIQEIKSLENNIKMMESNPFVIYFKADKKNKNAMLAEFVRQRGWTKSKSKVRKSRRKHPGKPISYARKKFSD